MKCAVYSVHCSVEFAVQCAVQVEDGVFEYAELHEAGGYTTLVREREKRERLSLQVNANR